MIEGIKVIVLTENLLKEKKDASNDFKLGARLLANYLNINYVIIDKKDTKLKKGWLNYETI